MANAADTEVPVPTHGRPRGGGAQRSRRRGGARAGRLQEHPDRQAGGAGGRHRPREVPQGVQGGAAARGAWSRRASCRRSRERIGQDPLVIKPLHEIGKYGGTWRGGFTGPADFWNGYRCCSRPGPPAVLGLHGQHGRARTSPRATRCRTAAGRSSCTCAAGMKWSDGEPFTADDFVFWFEDIYRNKDLVPTPSAAMAINGKPGKIEKVDTYTVKFKFPDPYYLLPDVLAGSTALGGQAWQGLLGMGGYAPAHYLKQFHPKYVGQGRRWTRRSRTPSSTTGSACSCSRTTGRSTPSCPVAHALEDRHADQHADLDAGAEPVQRLGRHRRATSCRTSTRSS